MENKYIKIFEDCQIVLGTNQAIICDLTRKKVLNMSKHGLEILLDSDRKLVSYFYNQFPNKETGEQIIKHLLDNEIVFLCDTKEELTSFPKFSSSYQKPSNILSHMIVDIGNLIWEAHLFETFIDAGTRHLQLRVSESHHLSQIDSILAFTKESAFKSFEIVVPHAIVNDDLIRKWYGINGRLKLIFLLGSGEFSKSFNEDKVMKINVKYDYCDLFDPIIPTSSSTFIVNHLFFVEASHKNIFYNGKVFISTEGKVKKSCFEEKSYGIVNRDFRIQGFINHPEVKKLWNTSKDDLQTCKDCEFRYICPDERLPQPSMNGNNLVMKELCNYDPYTGKWTFN